ncbi:hypothetical protein HY734_02930 [Candidatus Uhrbacteria bacterium]|nr:hypothetical protein [Candidatus Uhrbacteria bacterium]
MMGTCEGCETPDVELNDENLCKKCSGEANEMDGMGADEPAEEEAA